MFFTFLPNVATVIFSILWYAQRMQSIKFCNFIYLQGKFFFHQLWICILRKPLINSIVSLSGSTRQSININNAKKTLNNHTFVHREKITVNLLQRYYNHFPSCRKQNQNMTYPSQNHKQLRKICRKCPAQENSLRF